MQLFAGKPKNIGISYTSSMDVFLKFILLANLAIVACTVLVPEARAMWNENNQQCVDRVLTWVPDNTVCISVAQAPFFVRSYTLTNRDPSVLFQSWLLWPLVQGEEHSVCAQFPSSDILLCIDSQTIRCSGPDSPEAKMGHWEHSGFVFLRNDRRRDAKLKGFLQAQAASQYREQDCLVYELPWGKANGTPIRGGNTYQICLPRSNLIVYSTDRTTLHQILARMNAKDKNRVNSLPANLPEWRCVDQNAPYWGVRHFSNSDRTSPSYNSRRGALDPQAEGFTFDYSTTNKSLSLRYLSSSKNIEGIAKAFFCLGKWLEGPLTISGSNPAIATTTISDDETGNKAVTSLIFSGRL